MIADCIGANNNQPGGVQPSTTERKIQLILRLLRGESLDAVASDGRIPAQELESWCRSFLESGMRGLDRIVDPTDPYAQLRRQRIRTAAG